MFRDLVIPACPESFFYAPLTEPMRRENLQQPDLKTAIGKVGLSCLALFLD